MILETTNCDFCNEINNSKNNFFNKNLLKHYQKQGLKTRIICKTKNFFLIPSVGSISQCHLLLCPLNHFTSYAKLSQDSLEEAMLILNKIMDFVKKEYGYAIAFEHGSPNIKTGSQSCNHAHIHIIAAQIPLEKILKQKGFELKKLNNLTDINSENMIQAPYFLIMNNTVELWITNDTVSQSQYLRLLCAKELGENNALWQNNICIDKMIKTNLKFKRHFNEIK